VEPISRRAVNAKEILTVEVLEESQPSAAEAAVLPIDRSHAPSRSENSAKSELLSHVSHELRTPLSAIHQFVTILRDGLAGPLNAEQTNCLDIA
jgi:signal transduction histidine kinase